MGTLAKIFFSLIFFVMLAVLACNSPTEPGVNDQRKYVWTTDTLSIPNEQITMNEVWGTTDNLYAVGHSSSSEGTMWHYDGTRWTNVKLGVFEGGPIETTTSTYNLYSLHGIDPNTIFAVGNRRFASDSSFIIEYNGTQWFEHIHPRGSFLFSVWVNAPNDVWACGLNGTLLHYDGEQWAKDSVVIDIPPGSTFYLSSIAGLPSGELYMTGYALEFGTPQMAGRKTHYFFKRENNEWVLLDTFVRIDGQRNGKWGGNELTVLPTGTMYSVDSYGLFKWTGTQWMKIYEHTNATAALFGTKNENLFVTGAFGLLSHYNGSDWFEYAALSRPNAFYIGGLSDENQVIVLGWVDGLKTVALKGRNLPLFGGR